MQKTFIPRWLLAAFVSCHLLFLSPHAQGDEYLPVALNAEWIMDVTFQSPDETLKRGTARRKMLEVVEQDAKTYHRSHTLVEVDGRTVHEYTKLVRKDAQGFHSIDERADMPVEQVEVVLPLKIGQSWKAKSGTMTLTHTVIAKESVEVAGRTYENVFRLRAASDDGQYVEDYWEAPRVGSVKAEVKVQGIRISLVLREFTPGKEAIGSCP